MKYPPRISSTYSLLLSTKLFKMASLGLMRILIATPLFPPDIGGPATYSALLQEELPKRGIEVDVISFGKVRHFPPVLRHILYTFFVFFRGWKADLLYAQDAISVGWPVVVSNFFLRKPFVLKIVGDHLWEQGVQRFGITSNLDTFNEVPPQLPMYLVFLQWLRRMVLAQALAIVVPSAYLKRIVTTWGVDPHKITVIHNGFEKPLVPDSKEELREKLTFKGTVLFSAGRLVPWKGFKELIEFLPLLQQTLPEVYLYIAGEGPERERLEKVIKDNALEQKVFLLGQLGRQTLWEYLKASDVFVLNTEYEGFSHQLLEVAALGVPMVVTRVGGNTEIVEDGTNGFLVDPHNKEQLRVAIMRAISEEGLHCAKRGQEKVKEFSSERMLQNIEALLRMVEGI